MKSSETRTPCILVADDQPDVLEALRFLIKGEGYQAVPVNSPAAVIDEVESRDFDAVLMDLNYTRDTTSGQEGLELLNRIQTAGHHAAGDRDDGVGQRGTGGGSDAPRGARFHPEAVGQRAAVGHSEDADRTGARAAPRTAAGGGEPRAARRALSAADRAIGGHAPGARRDLARRPVGRQRVHHRRERHRQGTGGADAALGFAALHAPAGAGEYRRPGGGRVRERALRPRQGRVYRRQERSRGPLRNGRGRHAVSGRNRQHFAGTAIQTAAHAGDRRVRARGVFEDAARGCARLLGDQCRYRGRGGRGQVPPGSAVPPEHHRTAPAAAARPPRRYSDSGRALPAAARRALPQAADGVRRSAPSRRCWRTPGRATCANWITPWSAPC